MTEEFKKILQQKIDEIVRLEQVLHDLDREIELSSYLIVEQEYPEDL